MLVTLIVPIYNSEKYLNMSLTSIINQTYTNLEIILINDGSTDSSEKICLKYAEKDKRIIYKKINNSGVSAARNMGIQISNGDYIGFIDADDYIEPVMIEKLIGIRGQSDKEVIICGIEQVNSIEALRQYKETKQTTIMNSSNAINKMLEKNAYQGYVCNKVFSKALLKDEVILFNEEIYTCEDMLFCTEAFLKAENIIYDQNKYYKYLIHGENNSLNYSPKKLTAITAYKKILKLIDENNDINKKEFINNYFNVLVSLWMQSIASGEKMSKFFKKEISLLPKKFNGTKKRATYFAVMNSTHLFYIIWKIRLLKYKR